MKEIVQAGGQARFVAADLGDAEQVRLLIEAVGEVDALVNTAASPGSAHGRPRPGRV